MSGPATKADAQRVLDLLIAEESGLYIRPDTATTVAMVAREYLALHEPNWGPHMLRTAGNLVRKHIVNGNLGERPIADLDETELQMWLNEYVNGESSKSLLQNLLLHVRAIWKHARKKHLIAENPTEDLRAKSKKRVCERSLELEECKRLLSGLDGRDHLIVRIFIQLGLRPEETFALRRDDVQSDALRVDEAIVGGKVAPVKSDASDAFVYIPPDLHAELLEWMGNSDGEPREWLFQASRGRRDVPLNANNYRERILQPAAIRAGVGLIDTGKKDENGKPILKTDVDFRALRRTCATLFGDKAKDPKTTQSQLRHADPRITLKHYQKSVPATVRAAAVALEHDLIHKTEGKTG